jgi:homoaconitase/3-isopropylmalate dehydratase large subunit
MGLTFAEKLLGDRAGRTSAAGETLAVAPDFVLSHDNTAAIIEAFGGSGAGRVVDPARIVIVLDHAAPPTSEERARSQRAIRAFVEQQQITAFYDLNRGEGHQVLPEEGFALPGRLILGTDPRSTTLGALGSYAATIDCSTAARIWATGEVELRVPETVKIDVSGRFPAGVGAMDLILTLIGKIGAGGARGRALELCGPAVRGMSMGGRMTLCGMAAETGAEIAHVPSDGVTLRYLAKRASDGFEPAFSDPDAHYVEILRLDVSELEPRVVRPGTIDDVASVASVASVAGQPVDVALLGTCVSGRVEDLWTAANRLRGNRVHPRVRLLVVPASSQVYAEAIKLGLIADLVESGAVVLNPGEHRVVLAPGEVGIGTCRGPTQAGLFLASPETVAASAITGCITDPRA